MPGFVIARLEVTNAEYYAFRNDPEVRQRLDTSERPPHLPRDSDGKVMAEKQPDGTWSWTGYREPTADTPVLGLSWQDVQQYLAAVEYKLAPEVSAIAQFQAATNPLTLGNSETDEDCGELAAGLQGRLGAGQTWGVWLRKDILGDTGPDATFAASVAWEF